MKRMEDWIEEMEKSIQSLKETPFIHQITTWNKELRDDFMKINSVCSNQQQMKGNRVLSFLLAFEQHFGLRIQAFFDYSSVCSSFLNLQGTHEQFKRNTLQTIRNESHSFEE